MGNTSVYITHCYGN